MVQTENQITGINLSPSLAEARQTGILNDVDYQELTSTMVDYPLEVSDLDLYPMHPAPMQYNPYN